MSNLDENMNTEYLYSEPVIEVETERKQSKKGAYPFLAVFFFILAVGGILIGMLTSVWSAFQQFDTLNFGMAFGEGGNASVFAQSLLGQLCSVLADLFGNKEIVTSIYPNLIGLSGKIWFIVYLFLLFAISFSAILALVLMIIALATKSRTLAKNSAMASGIILFLMYGGYFLLTYAVGGVVDAPSALIGGLILFTLIITAIARRKGYGLLSSLLLVLTVICIMMLNYSAAMLTRGSSLTVFQLYDADMFLGISMMILVVMLALNFLVSTLRICARRNYLFDAVRYCIQLIAVILTIIAFIVFSKDDKWAIFTADGQTLATVILLVGSVAAFVTALLALLLSKKKEVTTQEIVVSDQPAYEPAYVRMPVENYAPIIQPVVMAQAPVQPVYQQPVYQPPVQQAPAPQPQPQKTETHVYVQQAERPEVPVTEFERKMQSLARGQSSVYDATPIPVSQQRINAEDPYVKGRKAKKQQPNPSSTYVYEGSQYVYDPFIKTLTVQERNEFGDLFIANIYGLRSYLPTYIIGGDNKMFFDRVFIYLGCYRNYISQELLEKIYLYVSKQ